MLFYVRNMLKLGLTYEKRKTFDSAYLTYSELTNTLVDYRLFDEEKWGLCYNIKEKNFQLEKDAILYPTTYPSHIQPPSGKQITLRNGGINIRIRLSRRSYPIGVRTPAHTRKKLCYHANVLFQRHTAGLPPFAR